ANLNMAAKQDIHIDSVDGKLTITASKELTLICGGSYIKISSKGIELGTPDNVKLKCNVMQKMGPTSLFPTTIELPLSMVEFAESLPCQLNLKISDIPGSNGIHYSNSQWRIVTANCVEDALMTDDVIYEGKTTQTGELQISSEESKDIVAQYNKHPGRLWIVNNNIAYQLQMSTLGDVDNSTKNIKAAQAMGYKANLLKEQKSFLNAVESNSQIEKNQLIKSIRK
ncbi:MULTISPECIES: DUF2345 domain-containing protein, partial [unclassified Gilliamella]